MVVPEKFQAVLKAAVQREVELIPMDLPRECPAAWVGGVTSDCIGYPVNGRVMLEAAAHAVGHLVLLHCGRVRDGGRFVCADPYDRESVLHALPMLLRQGCRELPEPMFSYDEERAADEAGAALLVKCGCWAEAYALFQATAGPGFRCLG